MSTPLAGTVQEPVVDPLSLPHPVSAPPFKKFQPVTIINVVVFLCVSCTIFLLSVILGRLWFIKGNTSRPPNPTGEYVSAILAGVFYSLSRWIIYVIISFHDTKTAPPSNQNGASSHSAKNTESLFDSWRYNLKQPVVWIPLSLLLGGPVCVVLSGLILRVPSAFPDIVLKDLVCRYLAALPLVVIMVFFVVGFGLSIWHTKWC
ncbi:hypothetical protein DL96DRAFT_347516 [Flagelloscypha sp. PMI_526]|nr:hypothetical protein DL96DRAFT_347516 [Flagelloscypha sp. PMI_526]